MTEKNKRYKLCYGRFGAYYYDRQERKELDLEDVLKLLNGWVGNMELAIANDTLNRIEMRVANIYHEVKKKEEELKK